MYKLTATFLSLPENCQNVCPEFSNDELRVPGVTKPPFSIFPSANPLLSLFVYVSIFFSISLPCFHCYSLFLQLLLFVVETTFCCLNKILLFVRLRRRHWSSQNLIVASPGTSKQHLSAEQRLAPTLRKDSRFSQRHLGFLEAVYISRLSPVLCSQKEFVRSLVLF